MNKIISINSKKLIILIIFVFILIFVIVSQGKSKTNEYFERIRENVSDPFCANLFQWKPNQTVLENAKRWTPSLNETYTDSQLTQEIKLNCNNFLQKQNYFLHLLKTPEEKSIPIAFSILTFTSASQVERLLRMIYRPWNFYCIHVDRKANKEHFDAMEELTECLNSKYNNIINTKNRVDVQWGTMSVLTADLNCMKELYERYKDWKYLINLTGQEFPLKTNAELAKILTAYKGANNLEGTYSRRNEERVPTIKIPFPMVWYKGSVHITANRDFVRFIFESPKSKILLNALKGRSVPDEQFFATLNFNSQFGIPGSFIGDPDEGAIPNAPLLHFMTRYKNWGEYTCESRKNVRGICIWGVGDLPKLVRAPHLFTNKFHEDFQPTTLHCMEKWYYDKVEHEIKTGHIAINSSFYGSMPFVKYRYIPPIE